MHSIKREKKWIYLIDESVHTSDDIDIGDIEAVNNNFIVVKEDLSIFTILYTYNCR